MTQSTSGGATSASGGASSGGAATNPSSLLTMAECTELGGATITDPGTGGLLAQGCPRPLVNLGEVGGFIEGALCCASSPKLPLASIAQCRALGGDPFSDPGDGSLLRAGCPNRRDLLALMSDFDEGGLCCKRALPRVDFAQCRQMGGEPVLDRGDGQLLETGCPDERELIGDASQQEVALCCRLPLISWERCGELGAEVHSDPGDGSLVRNGCPNGRTRIAFISGLIEGGLCCQ